jgi:hypothetical protein
MPTERRKTETKSKPSPLPVDYTRMVEEVLAANFDSGLKALKRHMKVGSAFRVLGNVYLDEIVLCVSLEHPGQLAATTVYASADFDPQASSPTMQDLLACCVDAAGSVIGELFGNLSTSALERLADESLSALERAPFEWTMMEVNHQRIHVKVDKANPRLDELADEWLEKNDPHHSEREAEDEAEAERLFVTPESVKRKSSRGPGNIH